MTSSPGEPAAALVAALRKILRPLVRLFLRHGITLPYLSNLLKSIYVDVAERDFEIAGKAQTDSRISLLTGMHRKDVRRLRAEPYPDSPPPAAVSLGAQVIATWLSEKKYQDKDSRPRTLAMRGNVRGTPTFEQLVADVSRQDLRPRVVLDELLRLELVTITPDETVALKVDGFIPAHGFEEKSHYFGENLRDHMSAAADNLDNDDPQFLERSVSYHQLTELNVAELHQLSKRLASDALKEVNRRARQMKRRNANNPSASYRINFGSYFYNEEVVNDENADAGDSNEID